MVIVDDGVVDGEGVAIGGVADVVDTSTIGDGDVCVIDSMIIH
jgi:hypothetical protein